MRDPERIEPMVERIKEIWTKFPDLRLLQLLHNVLEGDRMAYYFEDDELFRRLGEKYNVK